MTARNSPHQAAVSRLALRHPYRDRILETLLNRGAGFIDAAALAGSGLAGIGATIQTEFSLEYEEIEGFPRPKIAGHPGRLLIGRFGDKRVAIFLGRVHAYEGADPAEITLPVQIAAGLGATTVVLTSSVGAINADYRPGELMFVADHLNLMGYNPLFAMMQKATGNPFAEGTNTPFVDLSGVYRTELFTPLCETLAAQNIRLHRGVLAVLPGPTYETPAEVRFLRNAGADAVCMSTVPEAIYAKYAGLAVVGLTLVTNRANDGTLREKPSHHEVLANAAAAADRFTLAVRETFRLL
ncbi:MAG: purine-nucleoside phosphorylase [Myxococcales bacterium]|nr:purine-nucleoside phosphorylase [Myxococcales bacterium]